MNAPHLASLRPGAGRHKANARERILQAALDVAEECGAGHLSLDAVAKHAGVSKGGLLYHFPSKDDLMRALVEHHLEIAEEAIRAAEATPDSPNAVATALVQTHRDAFECRPAPPSGILAAFAENPALFDPVRAHHRRIVERIRASASDPDLSLIACLVLEGIKAHDIFELGYLTTEERARVLDTLMQRLLAGS